MLTQFGSAKLKIGSVSAANFIYSVEQF